MEEVAHAPDEEAVVEVADPAGEHEGDGDVREPVVVGRVPAEYEQSTRDREHREPILPVQVHSARGEALRPRDIMITAGPGATAEARERIEELEDAVIE